MQTLQLDLGTRSYPIYIGDGILQRADLIEPCLRGRPVIITNETLAPLYLGQLSQALQGKNPHAIILQDGETHKNLHTLEVIFDDLLTHACDRHTTLLALGGGVIGDITGFAAACYQRGIDFIQIPTSLLAQVDSSVGGKTGVNHRLGKNMIGAFHQPRCVLIDVATLNTLSEREFRSGLAEVIKYGLINDRNFFLWLSKNIHRLEERQSATLSYAIEQSCRNKAHIVSEDETEQGRRALLNLGHTFGHAIETHTKYQQYTHGEAVAIGMCMAAHFSTQLGMLEISARQDCCQLIRQAGLPVTAPPIAAQEFIAHMRRDKKTRDGVINLVLLEAIGAACLSRAYTENQLSEFIDDYCRLDADAICA